MAEDLKEVIAVVDDLKASNIVNVQILKKALFDINARLEEISEGEELIFVRNSLADFKQTLDDKFCTIFENLEQLKNEAGTDEISLENANLIQDKFKSLFSIFDSSIKLLTTKVDDIEAALNKTVSENFDETKETLAKISDEIKVNQRETVETAKIHNENTIERFSFVAESIKLLSENLNIQTDMYKDFVEKRAAEIRELVEANGEDVKEGRASVRAELGEKFRALEDANEGFAGTLDEIKSTISDILSAANEIEPAVSKNFTTGIKQVADVAQDTLGEIKILQDYSTSLTKSVNKIVEFTQENKNEGIIDAIKELDISKNIADLFEKVDIFNNNFNIKTEFLEDQILQMKTMFGDISVDIQNKEAEIFQRENQRVQEYYQKIEKVSESILNLEESLKMSGIEYKENITTLNQELGSFIAEFNTIYNELAGSTQLEITNSLEELKQFLTVNASNYNDKLVIIQEQFTQTFRELYEVIKTTSNYDFISAGIKAAKEATDEHNRLLESLGAKLDVIVNDSSSEEIALQNEQTQELVKILNSKVDKLLAVDFNAVSDKQDLVNKKVLDSFQSLSAQAQHLTKLAERPIDNTAVLELNQKILSLISEVDVKLDILATTDYTDNFEELLDGLDESKDLIVGLDEKLDDNFGKIENKLANIDDNVDKIDTKIDLLDYSDNFDNLLNKVSANKSLIDELHTKLDVFVSTNDSELLEDELQEIKDIILEQQEILAQSKDGEENKQVSENIAKLITRIDGIADTISEHDENSSKIKEDLVNTIVSVFSNSNFVEETEDIKDFVEEKTGELSKQLIDVKSQIETMKQSDVADYSYTLADVENDIANLRQAMKDLSTNSSAPSQEYNQISRNIHNLTSSIDAISKNLTPAEIYQLKHNILKLNDDILSISSRTNKLILSTDESQKTLSEGLEAFSHIAYNLEERMAEMSNKEFNAETAARLEKMLLLLENSASMDATFHKVLMFLGEWVDAASNSIEKINDKTDEINEISEALSELRKAVPEKLALVELLEERFEEQQSRIDRLEIKLDELSEMVKTNNNLSIVPKVDKLESLLLSVNANVEKLTSYVD